MENESIFGVEPEQLNELLSVGDDEPDSSVAQNEHPPSNNRSSDEKARSPEFGSGVDAFIEKPGSWIGPYKLLSVLGEGGMGMAYLAEQKQPMRRQVAIKVIKPGMDSRRVVSRFEAERQALALLDHPNIAHVYDAGTTELGRPYFVMEYVKGLQITDYCDQHRLTIEDRLGLFLQICQAVHHAHQKGIIHRDLKPSNILVSVENDRPTPKIIDFGVAKAIGRPLTDRTAFTEDSQLLGTPEYMSPEQADRATEDIDTRSDVYSLGVLLYVLLTGVLPFDSPALRDSGIENIRKTIRETDPKTPSTRLNKLGKEAKKVAENRRTEIHTLARHLKKELEWIPLKAMRKERSERYRSASELSDDIENYLKGAPLIAGPLTTRYRFRKFLRRHTALVGGVAAVLAVSIIGAIISLTFAFGQARARAESEAVTNFLGGDVLQAVSAIKGRDATVTDMLDTASKNLEGTFEDQPRVEAQIRLHLGRAYGELGDHRPAIPHLVRSHQLHRELFGKYASPTLDVMNRLAGAYREIGQYSESERLYNELIKEMDPQDVKLPWRKCNLACAYLEHGRYEEAERLFVEMLTSETAWWERGRNPTRKPYTENLALTYLYQGRYEEAEKLFNEGLEKKDPNPRVPVYGMHGLGCLYMAQGDYEKAEKLFKEGIELGASELPGKDHPHTLLNVNSLAVLRTKQKQYEEAERLFLHALEARKYKRGEDHPNTLETKNDLAVLYKEQARYDEAEPLLLEALEGRRLIFGDKHPFTVESLNHLIALYDAWNKPEEAEKWRTKLTGRDNAEKRQ